MHKRRAVPGIRYRKAWNGDNSFCHRRRVKFALGYKNAKRLGKSTIDKSDRAHGH